MPTFDEFWQGIPERGYGGYPRTDGKIRARVKWDALSPEDQEAAIDGVLVALQSGHWSVTHGRKRYIPHAKTYLYNHTWDELLAEHGQPVAHATSGERLDTLMVDWRGRTTGYDMGDWTSVRCPHVAPLCPSRDDCDDRQVAIWESLGKL